MSDDPTGSQLIENRINSLSIKLYTTKSRETKIAIMRLIADCHVLLAIQNDLINQTKGEKQRQKLQIIKKSKQQLIFEG